MQGNPGPIEFLIALQSCTLSLLEHRKKKMRSTTSQSFIAVVRWISTLRIFRCRNFQLQRMELHCSSSPCGGTSYEASPLLRTDIEMANSRSFCLPPLETRPNQLCPDACLPCWNPEWVRRLACFLSCCFLRCLWLSGSVISPFAAKNGREDLYNVYIIHRRVD